MVPELVTVKVTEPGAAVGALSSIEYSLSVAVMAFDADGVDADGVDADGVDAGGVDADCDAALHAVARAINPTSPARAVWVFMLSPSSLYPAGAGPRDGSSMGAASATGKVPSGTSSKADGLCADGIDPPVR
jgi:hypothetical protein